MLFFSAVPLFAQRDLERTLTGVVNPEELVTLSENIAFDQAIEILSRISEKNTGKPIVTTVSSTNPIGVLIEKMPYKKALTIIVQYADLTYEEKEESIVIKKKGTPAEALSKEIYAPVDSREIKISAIFFEADVASMKEKGINWQAALSRSGLNIGSELRTASESANQNTTVLDQAFNTTVKSTFKMGEFSGTAAAIFRFFETQNLGEVIASPSITVRDNQAGRIQVGVDFSTKQRDFAGNTIEKFFETGSIIDVTPHYYKEDGVEYVLLNLKVERSSAFPSEISSEIRKTMASTQVLMLDNEETVIGGLFINDETKVRTGIPFLKDLPWWVLGIRYLTGSDQVKISKKEVVILVKVEILPTLKERVSLLSKENKIKKEVENNRKQIKDIKFNTFPEEK